MDRVYTKERKKRKNSNLSKREYVDLLKLHKLPVKEHHKAVDSIPSTKGGK